MLLSWEGAFASLRANVLLFFMGQGSVGLKVNDRLDILSMIKS